MATFPNAVKSFLTLVNGVDKVLAAHPNDRAAEITAIQTWIGGLGTTQGYSDNLKNMLRKNRGRLISCPSRGK